MSACDRRRRGVYSPQELATIQSAGLRPVYAQITPSKCLVAAAFLEELYLGPERPWRIEPTPRPQVGATSAPPGSGPLLSPGSAPSDDPYRRNLEEELGRTLALEVMTAMAVEGRQFSAQEVRERARMLADVAERTLLQTVAWPEAKRMTAAVDDVLVEGGFYTAFGEVIRDFVTYPYAVLRGPVMRVTPRLVRRPDGSVVSEPRSIPTWQRVDPALVWWTPGSVSVGDALIIEVMPFLPSDLELYASQPGFDAGAIAEAIRRFGATGWRAERTQSIGQSASLRRDPSPDLARGSLDVIEVVAISGRVPGSVLREMTDLAPVQPESSPPSFATTTTASMATPTTAVAASPTARSTAATSGPSASASDAGAAVGPSGLRSPGEGEGLGVSGAPEGGGELPGIQSVIAADRTYFVQAWIVDDLVLYFELTDDPAAQPPYAIASYDPVPGSLVGRALPEMLADVQDAANATLRALVANVGIASGPQVVVDVDRLADRSVPARLAPWKVWHVVTDPASGPSPPISFYQPPLNVEALVASLQTFMQLADDVSGLPRYMGGNAAMGTLGRTASGVAMVMGGATRVMRTVARSLDDRVLRPMVERVQRWVAQSDPTLAGDLQVVVRGATRLAADDTRHARLLELLTVTTNPVDMQLLGIDGRLRILQGLAEGLGLPYELVVPSPEQVRMAQATAQASAQTGQLSPAGSPSAPTTRPNP